MVYCVIKGIHAPLLKSNFSTGCKRTTVLLYCLMFIPLMVFYFINFTVFVYILSCYALLVNFLVFMSNAAVHIMNNRSTQRDTDSRIAPLDK